LNDDCRQEDHFFTVVVVFVELTGVLVATVVTTVGLGVVDVGLTAAFARGTAKLEIPNAKAMQKVYFMSK
jgi:hypothetical protein